MVNKFLKTKREDLLFDQGYDLIVGIDEVGRGAWAGPLYLCAYIYSKSEKWVEGIKDSKLLSKTKRELLISKFNKECFVLKIILNTEIDELGLGYAMNKALKELILEIKDRYKERNTIIIVDGYFKGDWGDSVVFEAKADRNIYSVACASVIAKVLRDNEMLSLSKSYPEYSFELNVGYGTQKHIEALEKHGSCEIHRKSYKPVKEIV
ncbi:ribonuclease HII [Candidatus Dojkabacteria bacterium]|nr:ribonuclease HII [Candidatus Dojkabacteria bacterium]